MSLAGVSDEDQPGPLSFFQEDYWHREQVEPGAFAHISRAFSLAGPLSLDALAASLAALVRRHDALASRFMAQDGTPVAWTDPSPSAPLATVDLTELGPAVQAEEVARFAQAELDTPFDLRTGPLLRATVLRLAERSHVLLLTVHHIVCDGWSLGVLLDDLGKLYGASVRGRVAALPAPPMKFRDVVAGQRRMVAEGLEDMLAYWRDQLYGWPPAPELAGERPAGSVSSYHNARLLFQLGPDIASGLVELGARERVTPFMALLAAFQTTLAAAAGSDDLVVASLFSGRTQVEFEPLVGLLATPTVFRARLGGHLSFRELLGQVRTVVLDAFEHQALPVTELIRRLDLGGAGSVSRALLSVWFNQIPAPSELRLPGITVSSRFPEPQMRYEKSAQTWDGDKLAFTVVTSDDEVQGIIDYNALLLDATSVGDLVSAFRTVVERALSDPGQRLADLIGPPTRG